MTLIAIKWHNEQASGATRIYQRILQLFVLKLIAGCVSADFIETNCMEMNKGTRCHCDVGTNLYDEEEFFKFEIQCFATLNSHSQFRLKIDNYNNIEIVCDINDIDIFEYLPSLDIGYIDSLSFPNCTEFGSKYLADVFSRWNIKKSIFFKLKGASSNLLAKQLNGFQNLRTLELENFNLSCLPDDLFRGFNIVGLYLIDDMINELHPDTFVTLERLSTLNLKDNNIKSLPPRVFRNQKELQHLDLPNNQIQNLRNDWFEGADSIKSLNLGNNSIKSISADTFSMLSELLYLYLDRNNLIELHADLFLHNIKLKILNLGSNMIRELHSNSFEALEGLKELHLDCNNIKYLAPGIFRNQTNLRILNLENNQLINLSQDCLRDATSIWYLNLRSNSIESIQSDTFSTLSRLKEIYLDLNNFIALPDGLLAHNINLKILSLTQTSRPLQTVPNEFFTELQNLENITLSCGLTSIPIYSFARLHNLRYINLSKNNFTSLDKDIIRHMNELQTLNLSYCGLQQLPDSFLYLLSSNIKKRMNMLDFSHNKLTSLRGDQLEMFAKLSYKVILSNNEIHEISVPSTSFLNSDVPFIVRIDLNHNPLNCNCELLKFHQLLQKHNSKIFFIYNSLMCEEPIHLRNESLQNVSPDKLICLIKKSIGKEQKLCPGHCECWRDPYDSTLLVNCTNGQLSEENEFDLESLKLHDLNSTHLYITDNNLMKLPTTLRISTANITQIYAANNQISNIEISNLPRNLSILDLRSNHLQRLSPDVLKALQEITSLQEIYLSNNKWICDCEAKLLLQFIKDNVLKIKDSNQMYCANTNVKKDFIELSLNDICPTIPTSVYVCLAIAIIGALIGFVSPYFFNKYEKQIKIWLYSHNLCVGYISEAEADRDKIYDAFISHSHHDEHFVAEHLHPQLELGPNKFKLCIHVRDFIVGESVSYNIVSAIKKSRRIIFVLTKHFVNSIWSRLEFQVALQATLKDKRPRIIMILYEDLGDVSEIDNELALYLQMNTYLQWGDPWFWEKLRYAMPHRESVRHRNNDIEMGNIS